MIIVMITFVIIIFYFANKVEDLERKIAINANKIEDLERRVAMLGLKVANVTNTPI